MIKIYTFLLCCCLFCPFAVSSQEETKEKENILEAPEGWRPERIAFPLSFAPSLDYQGFEDIRFAPGWSKEGMEDFWSYTFVWYLNTDPELTASKLQEDIEAYFNGLMLAVAKGNEIPEAELSPTIALFLAHPDQSHFIGKVSVFDSFFLKKTIVLNMLVYPQYCDAEKKYVALFRVSPQPFTHAVWGTMGAIGFTHDCDP